MSEWKVEVVRLGPVTPLENSDALSITHVHGGYPCIVRRGEFQEGQLAIYCPIDSVVPTTDPLFAFLTDSKGSSTSRIKARRLRGTFSMGLLVPAEPWYQEGADVAAALGITKWEPDTSNVKNPKSGPGMAGGANEPTPPWWREYTDLESIRKWGNVFEDGEEVVITEKLHGSNMTACFTDGRLWVSSHYKMKRRPRQPTPGELRAYPFVLVAWYVGHVLWNIGKFFGRSLWRRNIRYVPKPKRPMGVPMTEWWTAAIDEMLDYKLGVYAQDLLIYGECIGVQDLKYGVTKPTFRAFDALNIRTNEFLDYDQFRALMLTLDVPMVPELYRGPWKKELLDLAEGNTVITGAKHCREGIVIKPVVEAQHPRLGRKILKYVGQNYLLRRAKEPDTVPTE